MNNSKGKETDCNIRLESASGKVNNFKNNPKSKPKPEDKNLPKEN